MTNSIIKTDRLKFCNYVYLQKMKSFLSNQIQTKLFIFKNIEIPSSKQHKTLVSFQTPPLRSSDKALLNSAMIT